MIDDTSPHVPPAVPSVSILNFPTDMSHAVSSPAALFPSTSGIHRKSPGAEGEGQQSFGYSEYFALSGGREVSGW